MSDSSWDVGPFASQLRLASGQAVHQMDTGEYFLDFIPGNAQLVITFEGAGANMSRPNGRRPGWGQAFLQKRGFSYLGVKPKRVDWYRKPDLHAFFRSKEFADFAGQFERRIFFGTSMGGYAALAFAPALPGSTVIAHNPQSTLDSRIVPWETRFVEGRSQDWSGDFADGVFAQPCSRRIYLTYDPFHEQDRLHVRRIAGPNVTAFKIPLVGHGTPDWLLQMGVLQQVTDQMLDGSVSIESFATAVRARRRITRYYTRLFETSKNEAVRARCLRLARDIDPADGELTGIAIESQYRKNDHGAVLETYLANQAMVGLAGSKRPQILAAVATSAWKSDRQDVLAPVLAELRAMQTENYRYHALLADLLLKMGLIEEAATLARRGLIIAPGRTECYLVLSQVREKQGLPKEALQVLEGGLPNLRINQAYRQALERLREQAGQIANEVG